MVFLNAPPEATLTNWRPAISPKVARSYRYQLAIWCRRIVVLATLLIGGLGLASSAWSGEFDEYAIKAAYLYNFAKFVEWPTAAFASDTAPLMICIAGENPFGDALTTLSNKLVENHTVVVRHLPAATGLDKCHIVFIGRAEQSHFKSILAKLAPFPVLTVSDIDDFAQDGGMIGLVEAEQRIRFNINLAVTRQANLKLSSQLLKLATIVN